MGIVVAARVAYWLAHFFVLDGVAPASRGLAVCHASRCESSRALVDGSRCPTRQPDHCPSGPRCCRDVVSNRRVGLVRIGSGSRDEAMAVHGRAPARALLRAVGRDQAAPARAAQLMERASRVTLLALLPAAILLVAFAEPGLRAWIGPAYSPDAGPVLRWLTVAVYVNAVARCRTPCCKAGSTRAARRYCI